MTHNGLHALESAMFSGEFAIRLPLPSTGTNSIINEGTLECFDNHKTPNRLRLLKRYLICLEKNRRL